MEREELVRALERNGLPRARAEVVVGTMEHSAAGVRRDASPRAGSPDGMRASIAELLASAREASAAMARLEAATRAALEAGVIALGDKITLGSGLGLDVLARLQGVKIGQSAAEALTRLAEGKRESLWTEVA